MRSTVVKRCDCTKTGSVHDGCGWTQLVGSRIANTFAIYLNTVARIRKR